MKNLRQASVTLFGGVLVACAFMAPSMASAASWGPLGTTHPLTSTNLRFDAHVPNVGVGGVLCTNSRMDADVRESTRLTLTDITFGTCHGTGVAADCTPNMRATNLSWSATGHSTTDVSIDGMQVDIHFTNRPGDPTSCIAPTSVTLTGGLRGGTWNGFSHQIEYLGATGLTAHIPGVGTVVATATGTLRDLNQTLTLT